MFGQNGQIRVGWIISWFVRFFWFVDLWRCLCHRTSARNVEDAKV